MYINKLLVQLFLLRCSNFLKKNSLFEFGKDFFLQKFFKFFFKKIPIFRRKFRRNIPSEIGNFLKKNFKKIFGGNVRTFPSEFPTEYSVGISVGNVCHFTAVSGFPTGLIRRIIRRTPSVSVGVRFCDELFPDDLFSVVISVGNFLFRRKNTLFPSVFPSQIRCIFVVRILAVLIKSNS